MSSDRNTDHLSSHMASVLTRAAHEPDYDETLLHKLAGKSNSGHTTSMFAMLMSLFNRRHRCDDPP